MKDKISDINEAIRQRQQAAMDAILKEQKKKKKVNPFEGSCLSMNRNETHTKTYRKTFRATMKV